MTAKNFWDDLRRKMAAAEALIKFIESEHAKNEDIEPMVTYGEWEERRNAKASD